MIHVSGQYLGFSLLIYLDARIRIEVDAFSKDAHAVSRHQITFQWKLIQILRLLKHRLTNSWPVNLTKQNSRWDVEAFSFPVRLSVCLSLFPLLARWLAGISIFFFFFFLSGLFLSFSYKYIKKTQTHTHIYIYIFLFNTLDVRWTVIMNCMSKDVKLSKLWMPPEAKRPSHFNQ